MPVFSVPITESSLIKVLEGANKVRIMGCGFCYKKNYPPFF